MHACHHIRGGIMGATSDDLMDIARAGAERIDMPDEHLRYPSFSDIEDQAAAEYDELLNVLHEDELFQPVAAQRQEEAVDRLKSLGGKQNEELAENLVANQTRQLWLENEATSNWG